MLQLFIDQKPATLHEGTKFKLTRENPLFTNAGDFTLEISLPLAGSAENQAIFGVLHRPELGKTGWVGRRLPFRLVALPIEVEGTMLVLGVTDEDVKVQLLGGRSGLNAACVDEKGNDLYIDELQLGHAYSGLISYDHYATDADRMEHFMREVYRLGETLRHGGVEETDFVAFPIYSASDKKTANATSHIVYEIEIGTGEGDFWPLGIATGETTLGNIGLPVGPGTKIKEGNALAPQPYLIKVFERVMQACGLRTKKEDNEIYNTWMANVFVANVRAVLEVRHMLPHWTVKEFIAEFQNFFGVVVEVYGRDVRVTYRSSRLQRVEHTASAVCLTEVVDDYEVQLDEENNGANGWLNTNVKYKFAAIDARLAIPDGILQKSVFINGEPAPSTTEEQKRHSPHIYVDVDSLGERKAFLPVKYGEDEVRYELQEVDILGAMFPHREKKKDLALRIVPVGLSEVKGAILLQCYKIRVYDPNPGNSYPEPRKVHIEAKEFTEAGTKPNKHTPWIMTTDIARDTHLTGAYSLGADIAGQEQKTAPEKADVLEVAFNPKQLTAYIEHPNKPGQNGTFRLGVGSPAVVRDNGSVHVPFVLYRHFCLHTHQTPSIRDTVFNHSSITQTTAQWVFDFADEIPLDPTQLFLIRGRKFLCEKIEISLTDYGIEPIKRGYFHEVE